MVLFILLEYSTDCGQKFSFKHTFSLDHSLRNGLKITVHWTNYLLNGLMISYSDRGQMKLAFFIVSYKKDSSSKNFWSKNFFSFKEHWKVFQKVLFKIL